MVLLNQHNSKVNPIPIDDAWSRLVDGYLAEHPDDEIHPAVAQLAKFLGDEKTTWEQQSSYLKEMDKTLRGHRDSKSTCPSATQISPTCRGQLEATLMRTISPIFFAAAEHLPRKYCIPIIEMLHSLSPDMFPLFLSEYSRYMSSDPLYESHSYQVKALTIPTLLGFSLGAQAVRERFMEVLEYLTSCLMSSMVRVEDLCANQLSSFSRAQLVGDCQMLAKTLLMIFTSHPAETQSTFGAVRTKCQSSQGHLFRRLVSACLNLCTRDDCYTRECAQIGGMALGELLEVAGNAEESCRDVIGIFFGDLSEGSSELITTKVGIKIPKTLVQQSGWNVYDPPMLPVARGMISNLRMQTLIAPIPAGVDFYSDLLKNLEETPRTLHHLLYFVLSYFCSSVSEPQSRVIAFEALGIWLLVSKQILSLPEGKRIARECFTDDIIRRLVGNVWDHWDDPVDAVQHKVKTIFEYLLEIVAVKAELEGRREVYDKFLEELLETLLAMDWHRKVKYALLTLLLPHTGIKAFLEMQPNFVENTMQALSNIILAPRATALLNAFFERQLIEMMPDADHRNMRADVASEEAYNSWISLWFNPLCQALTSPDQLIRKNIANLILPRLLKASPKAFWRLLHTLQDTKDSEESGAGADYRLHALVSVVKVGRSLDIFGGEAFAEGNVTNKERLINTDFLYDAMSHSDTGVRTDALGILCESRRSTAEPTPREFALLRSFILANMNITSADFRQKLGAFLGKLLLRTRTVLYTHWRNYQGAIKKIHKEKKNVQMAEEVVKKRENEERDKWLEAIAPSCEFLNFLVHACSASLQPGASFQRVSTALRILGLIVRIFGVEGGASASLEPNEQSAKVPWVSSLPPNLRTPLIHPRLTQLLLSELLHSFAENRLQAFDLLIALPNPLPGVETEAQAQNVILWGLERMKSTRAGESNSGATIFRLIFRKYIVGLGYELEVEPGVSGHRDSYGVPAADFTSKLLDMLEKQTKIASENLLFAAQSYPLHGTLLALQYLVQELDYSDDLIKTHLSIWQSLHARALSLVHSTCSIVLDVLSNPSPEGNMPASFQEMEENIDELIAVSLETPEIISDAEAGPKQQVILSFCWRAVKEASALLGTIVARAPIASESGNNDGFVGYDDMVNACQLFRVMLTSIRHRGAFSAVYPGYVELCTRLRASSHPKFSDLPALCLEEHIQSILEQSISITRRSAGLPFCVLAVVSSEPHGRHVLLPMAMNRFIEIASRPTSPDADQTLDLPQVHAFNVLRTIFTDAKLGQDVLPFVAEGYEVAIRGFSSHTWAIRNCAVMLFSTLLQRTFGAKKTRDEHHTINTLTGREFFARFPRLHPFLLAELQAAVDDLLSPGPKVNSALYPVLTLLSRLHPSLMEGTDTILTTAPFVPLVMSCAKSSIFKTREMAARALAPLVTSGELVSTCAELLNICCSTTSQNEMHGRLAQIQLLLRGHLYNVASPEIMLDLTEKLPDLLLSAWTILLMDNRCAITRALFLQIVTEFCVESRWLSRTLEDEETQAKLLAKAHKAFALLKEKMSEFCREVLSKTGEVEELGQHLVRQQAAEALTFLSLDSTNAEVFLSLLSDCDYEVRFVTLQRLSSSSSLLENDEIRTKLARMLIEGEPHVYCFDMVTELLAKLPEVGGVDLAEFWEVVEGYATGRKGKASPTKMEAVLPLLGSLTLQTWRNPSCSEEIRARTLKTWSNLVYENSHPDKPLSLREAVVSSVEYFVEILPLSRDIAMKNEDTSESLAKIHMTLARLLQDDDADVRDEAAEIVGKLSGGNHAQTRITSEKALKDIYTHILSNFPRSPALYRMLLSTLLANEEPLQILEEELNPSRVLFAVEKSNIYKEDQADLEMTSVALLMGASQHKEVVRSAVEGPIREACKKALDTLKAAAKLLEKESPDSNVKEYGALNFTSRERVFFILWRAILVLSVGVELLGSDGPVGEIQSMLIHLSAIPMHPQLHDQLYFREEEHHEGRRVGILGGQSLSERLRGISV
ncbi:uncharacterized protein VTP21DRAFT_114 [Calcarisporiella thermophila]|uniref:uncharacterized protein n=1 Tax=Calcarisporiella thermophila TaxID=911321 RepID=UPI003744102B